jgi:hypothetical protein
VLNSANPISKKAIPCRIGRNSPSTPSNKKKMPAITRPIRHARCIDLSTF